MFSQLEATCFKGKKVSGLTFSALDSCNPQAKEKWHKTEPGVLPLDPTTCHNSESGTLSLTSLYWDVVPCQEGQHSLYKALQCLRSFCKSWVLTAKQVMGYSG